MTTDLVGPLPTIRFLDGSTTAYEPPRDTCDNRASACTDHHPACDCRESMFAEDRGEHRAAMEDAKAVIAHLVDSPCPPEGRSACRTCRNALTFWLGRYESLRIPERQLF